MNSTSTGMKLCFLVLISFFMALAMSGCAEIGFIGSEHKNFSGHEQIQLREANPNILQIVADVGKDLGYSVSSLDNSSGMISLSSQSSMVGTVLIGKISIASLTIRSLNKGKTLNVSVNVSGNFGTGDQDAGTKLIDSFKVKLLNRLGETSLTQTTSSESTRQSKATNSIGVLATPNQVTVENDVDFRKLASPTFAKDYIGKTITFRAKYFGEWTEVKAYELNDIDITDRVFLNLRDISEESIKTDNASMNALLSAATSYQYPQIISSIEKNKAELVFKYRKGDIVLVTGTVEAPSKDTVGSVHVKILQIQRGKGP